MEPESLGMELKKHIFYPIQVILMQSIGSPYEGTFEVVKGTLSHLKSPYIKLYQGRKTSRSQVSPIDHNLLK